MPEGLLRYDVSKLKKNMQDHGDYLTNDLLAVIPNIIADPIAITEYSQKNTISVFGEYFVGKSPMMVGITISRDRAGNDISKVRTFNARRDVGQQITDSTVLYLGENKKRTLNWFHTCGIQVPLGGNSFGPIRSITQNVGTVNQNSDTTPQSISNRTLLANAIESLAKNEVEEKYLSDYKAKIETMNAEEQKLSEIKAQIKELSFAKGPRDTKKIRDLQFKSNEKNRTEKVRKIKEKQTNQSATSGDTNMAPIPHTIKFADDSSDKLTVSQKQRTVNRKNAKYASGDTDTTTSMAAAFTFIVFRFVTDV